MALSTSPHAEVLDVTFGTREDPARIVHQHQAFELARALVERQEGALRVQVSERTVTVSLRFGAVCDSCDSEQPPSQEREEPTDSRPKVCSLLLVEDDPDMRETLAEVLSLQEGIEVTTAIHGLDALEKLKTADTLPDVILTDLMMPIMDGKELRRAVGANPTWRDIPIIVLSANAEVAHGYELKVEGILRKPVPLDRLLQVLLKACHKRHLNLQGSPS